MAGHPYSICTLQDNWCEDRLDRNEKGIKNTILRPMETSIANLSENGFEPLTRIARVEKKASYAVPLDGFPSVKESSSHIHYEGQKSSLATLKNKLLKPTFINGKTIHEVCIDTRPPAEGPRSGHGAILDRYGDDHDKRYWVTTTASHYTQQGENKLDRTRPAGLVKESKPDPKFARLVGEKFLKEVDPSVDTMAQRAWLYVDDPSFEREGKPFERPQDKDNETSLPLGNGAQAIIRERLQKRINEGSGMLFLSRTDITKAC